MNTQVIELGDAGSHTHAQLSTLPTPPSDLNKSLPLPPGTRSIRLLDLEPLPSRLTSKESKLDPTEDVCSLSGYLRAVSLASSPNFTALSYVWGESHPTVTTPHNSLRCGTCLLPPTANCADALRVLRHRTGRRPLSVWIDALCINQDDAVEKADQLLLMEEIYQWAYTVYV